MSPASGPFSTSMVSALGARICGLGRRELSLQWDDVRLRGDEHRVGVNDPVEFVLEDVNCSEVIATTE